MSVEDAKRRVANEMDLLANNDPLARDIIVVMRELGRVTDENRRLREALTEMRPWVQRRQDDHCAANGGRSPKLDGLLRTIDAALAAEPASGERPLSELRRLAENYSETYDWKPAPTAPPPQPTQGEWYLGSMNDALFIIDRPPSASGNEHPWHDNPNGPKAISAAIDERNAKLIVEAHNAALRAKSPPSQGETLLPDHGTVRYEDGGEMPVKAGDTITLEGVAPSAQGEEERAWLENFLQDDSKMPTRWPEHQGVSENAGTYADGWNACHDAMSAALRQRADEAYAAGHRAATDYAIAQTRQRADEATRNENIGCAALVERLLQRAYPMDNKYEAIVAEVRARIAEKGATP